MNKRSQEIINELLQENLISNESDLTANDKTNFVFDYMINKYSYLFNSTRVKPLKNIDEMKNIVVQSTNSLFLNKIKRPNMI